MLFSPNAKYSREQWSVVLIPDPAQITFSLIFFSLPPQVETRRNGHPGPKITFPYEQNTR